jgi:hypothetical protein
MGWQMIKITVDEQVYEALQKAFPKPANTAHRALAKYISVLETMLFKSLHFAATPLQRKFDLFAISLQQLANQGGQIGPNKLRVHAWLRNNNFNLVEAVITGSNLTGSVSQCKLTKLVTMVDTLAVEDKILRSGKSDTEIDQYLCGDDFGNYQVLNLLFPEFKQRIKSPQIEELFDLVPVDKESVKSYIIWLTTESEPSPTSSTNYFGHIQCDGWILCAAQKAQPLWTHVLRGHQCSKHQQGIKTRSAG